MSHLSKPFTVPWHILVCICASAAPSVSRPHSPSKCPGPLYPVTAGVLQHQKRPAWHTYTHSLFTLLLLSRFPSFSHLHLKQNLNWTFKLSPQSFCPYVLHLRKIASILLFLFAFIFCNQVVLTRYHLIVFTIMRSLIVLFIYFIKLNCKQLDSCSFLPIHCYPNLLWFALLSSTSLIAFTLKSIMKVTPEIQYTLNSQPEVNIPPPSCLQY